MRIASGLLDAIGETAEVKAVLDTTEPELLPADSPLYDLPNVFLTPHIARTGEDLEDSRP